MAEINCAELTSITAHIIYIYAHTCSKKCKTMHDCIRYCLLISESLRPAVGE